MPDNNAWNTALTLAPTATAQSLADSVTAALPDFYRFTLAGRSSLNLTLSGLSGNADLQLLDSAGAVLQSSSNQGTLAESINRVLAAGTYYLQVSLGAGSAAANYSLGFQAQSNPYTDIAWRNYAGGQNTLWQVNGTGGIISNTGILDVSDVNWRIEATGDFNGDGQQDLVWRYAPTGELRVWTMDGASLVSISGAISGAADPWQIKGTGDFNGDGKTDLVWRNQASGQNLVWFLDGTTYIGQAFLPNLVDTNWQLQGVGDFNGDGQRDLVWRNYASGDNAVWFLNGTAFAGSAFLTNVADLNWQIQGVGDLTGDGLPDLFWRNMANGQNVVWAMSGTTLASVYAIAPITDLNWRATAPLSGFAAPNPIDVAGNALETAFNIGTLNGYGVYQDTVSNTDPDFYKFSLSQSGRVNLGVYGGADATLVNYGGLTPSSAGGKRLSLVLNPGTYFVQVYAGSLNGYVLELNAIPIPSVPPSLLQLTSSSDSGRSTSDRVTKVNTPIITGRAEANATVQVFSGTLLLGQTTANANGDWQFTTGTLANGNYSLTAKAVSPAGDASAASAALALTIDSLAPNSPSVLSLVAAGKYAVTVRGNAEVGSQVQLFEGSEEIGQATTDATGAWQVTIYQISNGTYQFTATATDLAGNTSSLSTAATLTVNTLVPASPQGLRLTAETDSGQSQSDNITSNLTPTVSGTAEAGATVRLLREQQMLGQTVVNQDGSWSLDIEEALPSGTYLLTAIATNSNGDSAGASLSVTIDPFVPTAQINTLENGSTTVAELVSGATLMTGMRLLGRVDGTLSAVASLRLQLGTNPEVTIPVATSGLFSYLLDLTGLNGSQDLTLTATDVAGNSTTLASYTVTVGAAAGGTGGTGDVPVLLAQLVQDTGSSATDGFTSLPEIGGVVSAQAPVTSLWAKFDSVMGSVFQDISAALSSDGTFALTTSQFEALAGGTLADGAYTLRLQARTDSNPMVEQVVSFTLDRTAPVLRVSNLLDGIGWERGSHLQGTVLESLNQVDVSYEIVDAETEASIAQHALTLQGGSAGFTFDQALEELAAGDETLQQEEAYNLILTSTDRAGNAQRTSFQFFVASDRLVEDDDPWELASGNNASTPRVDPPKTTPVVTTNVNTWGYYGGGGWGYYGGGTGGISPGYEGTLTPTVKNSHNPVVTGAGYEFQYVEGLGKIVDRAVDLISTEPLTINEKAALKNRASVLLGLGTRLNALIQPGGFVEAKDQALIDQMRPVMEGLFAEAYDPRGATAGIFKGYENWAGAWLAQQLVADSLKPTNPTSVRVQVFQATLLEVVTEVFSTKGITLSAAQQAAVSAAVMELAKTYAWLKPTAEATVPTAEADYGFLDLLWRLQIPGADGRFKGSAVIQADLDKSVAALGRLLDGVQDPVKAIQFLNDLVQSETYVTSLKTSVKQADFLRENVKFGFKVAKIGLTTTSSASADEAASVFLNTLLKDGNTKEAKAGVGQFFAGLKTTQERVKSLEFADRLLDAAQLTTGLGVQKTDAKFLSNLVRLGGAYTVLETKVPASESTSQLFLDTAWQDYTNTQTLKTASQLEVFFLNFNGLEGNRLLNDFKVSEVNSVKESSDFFLLVGKNSSRIAWRFCWIQLGGKITEKSINMLSSCTGAANPERCLQAVTEFASALAEFKKCLEGFDDDPSERISPSDPSILELDRIIKRLEEQIRKMQGDQIS